MIRGKLRQPGVPYRNVRRFGENIITILAGAILKKAVSPIGPEIVGNGFGFFNLRAPDSYPVFRGQPFR